MARSRLWLTMIIAAELGVGGLLIARRLGRPRCPRAPLEIIDAAAAADLAKQSQRCVTANEWAEHAESLLAYGFFPESEACYRQAAQMSPNDPDIRFDWAFALTRIGLTKVAIEQLQQALALDVQDSDSCWYFIGRNYLRQEDEEQARAAFERAAGPASQYELAKLSVRAGDADAALSRLAAILSEIPGCLQPSLLRARVWTMLEQPGKAARDRQAAEQAAEQAANRLPTALDSQRERFDAARQRIGLLKRQAACQELLSAGKTQRAAAGFRQALEVEWSVDAARQLAELEMLLGRLGPAERLLQEALKRDGPSTRTLTLMGRLLLTGGHHSRAQRFLQRAVKMAPASQLQDAHSALTELHQQLGDETKVKWHTAMTRHAQGCSRLAQGQLAEAQQDFSEAVSLAPRHAHSWYCLGEVLRLLDDQAAAQRAYRRCLAIDPDHGRARARTVKLEKRIEN